MTDSSRCDLHLHSRHSNRSAEWLLRRFEFPDSYSDPRRLYDSLKDRGMDFVTLTDHNTIAGCLELAEEPDVFISEEVTAYFPEDRCKVHLLVWDITEDHHEQIAKLREDIYHLAAWLEEQSITHAVAHPFYSLNQRLDRAHLEKLILLFDCFETLNGLRDALLGEVADFVCERLTPEKITEMESRHGIRARGKAPWKKIRIGGSDDHGGLFQGMTYTETPHAESAAGFLAFVRAGECRVNGRGGTPLALSHSMYNTVYHFAQAKFARNMQGTTDLLEKMFSRFLEGRDPTEFSIGEKLTFLAEGILSGRIFELANPASAGIWRELAEYFNREELNRKLRILTSGVEEPERRAFLMANHVANELAFRFFNKFLGQISTGNFLESVQAVTALVPIVLSLSPYIYSLQSQTTSRMWLRTISSELTGGEIHPALRNSKRAWFTDTLEDVNGVTTTIRKMTAAGVAAGKDIVVVTSRSEIDVPGIPIKNFEPIGEFELPEYELQKLSFPPILNILDWVQSEGFTEIVVSTPGPIGLCGLLAAKMFGIRVTGIYHTDFPQYVSILTDDGFFETLTWNYMHWFYSQLDTLFVNSEFYRKCWIDRGIEAGKIAILPRGLDTELFSPDRRDQRFWKKFGASDNCVTLLYVGRISKEKDLDVLATAFNGLLGEFPDLQLVFVGDGPYHAELETHLPKSAYFTGYLSGLDLATAYASADIFAFPSTTDTFGNVLLEAQSSGLPAVVSDVGGPRELVRDGVDGLITPALDVRQFAGALRRLITDQELRVQMGRKALEAVKDRDWSQAFERFWAMSPE